MIRNLERSASSVNSKSNLPVKQPWQPVQPQIHSNQSTRGQEHGPLGVIGGYVERGGQPFVRDDALFVQHEAAKVLHTFLKTLARQWCPSQLVKLPKQV